MAHRLERDHRLRVAYYGLICKKMRGETSPQWRVVILHVLSYTITLKTCVSLIA